MSTIQNLAWEPTAFGAELQKGGASLGGDLGGLFQEEVERVVERQGGKRAIDERRTTYGAERRATRHEGFGQGGRDGVETPIEPSRRAQDAPLSEARNSDQDDTPLEAPVRLDNPVQQPDRGSKASGSTNQPTDPAPQSLTAPGPPPSAAIGPAAPVVPPQEGATAGLRPSGPGSPVTAATEAPSRAPRRAPALAPTPEPAGGPTAEEIEKAQRILEQLRVGLAGGRNHLTVDLNPADLGRLNLHVSMRRGKLHAVLRADSPETLRLLEQRVPEIRELLGERGIAAESFDLHLGFGQEHPRGNKSFRSQQPSLGPASPPEAAAPIPTTSPQLATIPSTNTGVDFYA